MICTSSLVTDQRKQIPLLSNENLHANSRKRMKIDNLVLNDILSKVLPRSFDLHSELSADVNIPVERGCSQYILLTKAIANEL